ncbi:MAG: hypothetical protein ACKKL6_00870 [Candidatus Komeilibacteria bacterium]
MYLTTHSAVGIAIATKTINPFFAFILAFIAHYILDMIPHGDEEIFEKDISAAKRYKKIISIVIFDLIITGIYAFMIMTKTNINPVIIFAAILGSILPDILWGIYDVRKIKILKPFVKFHNFFHNPAKKNIPFKMGIAMQIALVVIIYILII